MMNYDEHPTVLRFHEASSPKLELDKQVLEASWLHQLALQAGADDAGCVRITRPELDTQRADILDVFPQAKTLLSFVCRMNREKHPQPRPFRCKSGIPPYWRRG